MANILQNSLTIEDIYNKKLVHSCTNKDGDELKFYSVANNLCIMIYNNKCYNITISGYEYFIATRYWDSNIINNVSKYIQPKRPTYTKTYNTYANLSFRENYVNLCDNNLCNKYVDFFDKTFLNNLETNLVSSFSFNVCENFYNDKRNRTSKIMMQYTKFVIKYVQLESIHGIVTNEEKQKENELLKAQKIEFENKERLKKEIKIKKWKTVKENMEDRRNAIEFKRWCEKCEDCEIEDCDQCDQPDSLTKLENRCDELENRCDELENNLKLSENKIDEMENTINKLLKIMKQFEDIHEINKKKVGYDSDDY
jgi:hypothetical protein